MALPAVDGIRLLGVPGGEDNFAAADEAALLRRIGDGDTSELIAGALLCAGDIAWFVEMGQVWVRRKGERCRRFVTDGGKSGSGSSTSCACSDSGGMEAHFGNTVAPAVDSIECDLRKERCTLPDTFAGEDRRSTIFECMAVMIFEAG